MIKTFLRVFVFIGLFMLLKITQAQQDPLYTNWRYNKILINPAFAGFGNKHCVGLNTRNNWYGFEDKSKQYLTQSGLPADYSPSEDVSPVTQSINYHGIIYRKKTNNTNEFKNYSINGSFAFVNDKIGYETNRYFKTGLAFNYTFKNGSSLRVGAAFSRICKKFDGKKLRPHDTLDPFIPKGIVSDNQNTLDGGIYYFNPNFKNIWAGISTTNGINRTFRLTNFLYINSVRHYYLMAGLELDNFLGNSNLTLSPALLVKTVIYNGNRNISSVIDLNGVLIFKNRYEVGLNFSGQSTGMNGMSLIIGYYPPFPKGNSKNSEKTNVRIGYSYDLSFNKMQTITSGFHEIQVNFCMPIKIKP